MEAQKDRWDKIKILATVFGTAAIPLALGLVGYWINVALKDRDVRLRTVELAVGILAAEPGKTPNTSDLRNWAVEVIDRYSGVHMKREVREELVRFALPRDSGASRLTKENKILDKIAPGGAFDLSAWQRLVDSSTLSAGEKQTLKDIEDFDRIRARLSIEADGTIDALVGAAG